MAINLPPPPTRADPGDFAWQSWYNSLYQLLTTTGTVSWAAIDKTGSSISDIVSRGHNQLTGFQGGTTNEYYHLTAAQYAGIGVGAHNSLTSIQGGAVGDYYHLTSANATKVINSRETLTANRTYYVATTGSDSNSGLAVGSPFLTIQKAVDIVAELDMRDFQVTIQVANGTYTAGVTLKDYLGTKFPIILGDATTPANVVISITTGACVIWNGAAKFWGVNGFKLQASGAGSNAAYAGNGAMLVLYNINFGATGGSHMYAVSLGVIAIGSAYTVSGGSTTGSHMYAIQGARISCTGQTVTINGTPNFTNGWIQLSRNGMADIFSNSFLGSATGKKYTVDLNSVCFAASAILPGSIAGTTATGGQYI